MPAFEEIESEVKTAWLGEQKSLGWKTAYQEMLAKYTVLLPKPPEIKSTAEPPSGATPAASVSSSGGAR